MPEPAIDTFRINKNGTLIQLVEKKNGICTFATAWENLQKVPVAKINEATGPAPEGASFFKENPDGLIVPALCPEPGIRWAHGPFYVHIKKISELKAVPKDWETRETPPFLSLTGNTVKQSKDGANLPLYIKRRTWKRDGSDTDRPQEQGIYHRFLTYLNKDGALMAMPIPQILPEENLYEITEKLGLNITPADEDLMLKNPFKGFPFPLAGPDCLEGAVIDQNVWAECTGWMARSVTCDYRTYPDVEGTKRLMKYLHFDYNARLLAHYPSLKSMGQISFPMPDPAIRRLITYIQPVEFGRFNWNLNTATFDFIRVTFSVRNEAAFPDRKEFIRNHMKDFVSEAYLRILQRKSFQKYGVPISFLKPKALRLMGRTDELELTFELKSAKNMEM